MRHALGRGMGAVRDRESVVDVIVAKRRHSPRQLRIVLLFAEMEARVFEDADVARQHGRDAALASGPWQSSTKRTDRPLSSASGRTSCAVDMSGRTCPFGRPKCDSSSTIAPLSASSSTVGSSSAKPRIVGHRRALHRHVQIDAHEHPLAGQVGRQIIKRLEAGRHDQISFAIAPAVSTMRFEKPHSLSYQLTTRTSLPSITAVSRLSMVELAGLWLRSIETSGSSV